MATLGLLPPYTAEDIEKAYLAKFNAIRPDLGGDREAFYAVQKAYMAAKEYVKFRGDRRGWIAKRMDEYLVVQEVIERIRQFGADVETDSINWLQKSFGDFADLTEEMRARFSKVVRDEVEAMSRRLDDSAHQFADSLKARWPLEEMLGADLIAATRRRIERAQDLLRSANLTVTEVCMMVGYSSLGSFSSRFRELTGESPVEYRERFARDGAPRIPGCFLFMRGVSVLDHRPSRPDAESSNPGEAP